MPNLEELIEIRNNSIEEFTNLIESLETSIKGNSLYYYNEKIMPQIEKRARADVMDGGIAFTILKDIVTVPLYYDDYDYPYNNDFYKLINSKNSKGKFGFNSIRLALQREDDPILAIELYNKENKNNKASYLYIRPSYIKELAEQDNLTFKYDEVGNAYNIKAILPKYEKKKIKSKKD